VIDIVVPILAFHKTRQKMLAGMNNYSPPRFYNLVRSIQQAGFEIVALSDYVKSSENEKQVAMTFDDGYEHFYWGIYQILTEMNLPAAVFVPADFIGRTDTWDYTGFWAPLKHLTRSQIEELSRNGIDFGSHGLTHENLSDMSARRLKLQLERSKSILEEITGKKTKFLSYPFGRFNKTVEESAIQAGYIKGFSLTFTKRSMAEFTLPRFAVYAFDTPYSILKKLGGGPLSRIEKMKSTTMNGYASGTIIFNRIRKIN
jgi:peptidoglycan/xylan/chitin deacetylase (PgdA/CDA1 family)